MQISEQQHSSNDKCQHWPDTPAVILDIVYQACSFSNPWQLVYSSKLNHKQNSHRGLHFPFLMKLCVITTNVCPIVLNYVSMSMN